MHDNIYKFLGSFFIEASWGGQYLANVGIKDEYIYTKIEDKFSNKKISKVSLFDSVKQLNDPVSAGRSLAKQMTEQLNAKT